MSTYGKSDDWYAVVVRPRSEKAVARAFDSRVVENYLPVYRGRYRTAGRFKDVDLPLFPQYVFCKMNAFSPGYILSTPGVFRFVAFGGQMAAIDSQELESIRRAVDSGEPLQPWPFLKAGDTVEVAEGPLRGVVGQLIRFKGECQLVLSLSMLQRSVAVAVERRWVRPCRQGMDIDRMDGRPAGLRQIA
jgi:transcription antitermination factor NusG